MSTLLQLPCAGALGSNVQPGAKAQASIEVGHAGGSEGSAKGFSSTALCRYRESSTKHAAQPLHICETHLTPQNALRRPADEPNLALCDSSICKGAAVQQAGGLLLAAHQSAGCLPEHILCWCLCSTPGVCLGPGANAQLRLLWKSWVALQALYMLRQGPEQDVGTRSKRGMTDSNRRSPSVDQ